MNSHAIISDNFQQAWIDTSRYLSKNRWEGRSLMVHISDSAVFDNDIHNSIMNFTQEHNLLSPKAVAYTIFPHTLYNRYPDRNDLFFKYSKPNGVFDRLRTSWGTYFYRMVHYQTNNGSTINQLENIIGAINSRTNIKKACYTIVIQQPGSETIRPMGGPCLNYIAIQLENGNPNKMGLLAVYRNHDFLERAYGNYWGLCNLLKFLADQTNYSPGWITCISSHAFVSNYKRDLRELLETLE